MLPAVMAKGKLGKGLPGSTQQAARPLSGTIVGATRGCGGGPSGGDGGHGGSIYLEANPNDNTLLRYRYNREFKADRGRHGEGSNCTGHSGADMILRVPVGTLVFDASGETIADLAAPGQRVLVAKGGRGGRGNQNFAKPWHQAPREHEDGFPGEERHLRLELRLLAGGGLVGF